MFKSKAPEKDKDAAANAAEVMGRTVQQEHSVAEQLPPRREPTTNAATRSCIGSGMLIVGNIKCNGPAQVFGRIKGELRASDLLIGDGAEIEGTVIAQDVTVCGRVKMGFTDLERSPRDEGLGHPGHCQANIQNATPAGGTEPDRSDELF